LSVIPMVTIHTKYNNSRVTITKAKMIIIIIVTATRVMVMITIKVVMVDKDHIQKQQKIVKCSKRH